jgi:hypothetical protein
VAAAYSLCFLLRLVAFFVGLALFHVFFIGSIDGLNVFVWLVGTACGIGTEARTESMLTAREK